MSLFIDELRIQAYLSTLASLVGNHARFQVGSEYLLAATKAEHLVELAKLQKLARHVGNTAEKTLPVVGSYSPSEAGSPDES